MYRILAAFTGLIVAGWRYRRVLLIRAMNSCLYTWGMRWIVPRIRFTWRHAKLPEWKVMRGAGHLESGDIILTTSHWQLTSMCIPGKLTHAALCIGIYRDRIAEMVAAGYQEVSFVDVCKASRVVIVQPDWDDDYKAKVIETAKSFEGTPYDAKFEFGVASLYCSELIYQADTERRLQADTADLLGLGRPYVSPMGLFNAPNVTVVWDSDNETKEETR